MSLQNYKNLHLDVQGVYITEKSQPEKVLMYLKKYRPDILVITGHDGIVDDEDNHTSDYFVRSVQIARSYESDLDNLVIFAGACQSNYEQLMDNGANFASSPDGILIHFLDPILVAEKIAYTSVREVLAVKEVVRSTVTGQEGIGGVETRGKLRLCYP
jgi:spore coat assembly protein